MRTARPFLAAALVPLTLVLAMLAAGCGGDDDETAFTPVAGTESPYCDTYRAWQVHELDGEGGEQPTPAAFEKYWGEYLEFNRTALEQAPPVIRDEWVLSERGVRTIPTPVLVEYGFDVARLEREGTAAEKAAMEPPPDMKRAQDTIHAYEDRVCGTKTPPAANVVFKADEASTSYCSAAGTLQSGFDKIAASKFDPNELRAFVTSDGFTDALATAEEAAPAAIASDVKAESEWLRTRWSDVIAEFDYDIRRVWLDGTAEDRAVFHQYHPDVAEHSARITAYEEQVCTK